MTALRTDDVAGTDASSDPRSSAPAGSAGDIELVLARVRALIALRAAWQRHLWEREGPSAGPFGITHAQADAALAGIDHPAAEAAWVAADPDCEPLLATLREATTDVRGATRLMALAAVFDLEPTEVDLLQVCVAAAADPSIGRLLAYLRDDATRPQVSSLLAARVLRTGRTLGLPADAAVFRWELVHRAAAAGEPDLLCCDPYVLSWVAGDASLDGAIAGTARIQPPERPLTCWPVAALAQELAHRLHRRVPQAMRVIVRGNPGSGRRTFAAVLAASVDLPLLVVDADAIGERSWAEVVRRAHRQAFLGRAAVGWTGESLFGRPWPADVTPFPLQFVIVTAGAGVPADPFVVDTEVVLPLPGAADRRHLWETHLPAVSGWSPRDFEGMLRRRRSTPGQIARAALAAPADPDRADDALRAAARPTVDGLVEAMECPFEADDLVVGDHIRRTLDELVYEAEVRVELWESAGARRLYPAGRGVVCLFAGSPGTGKTMAAQVIARRLHAELLRIDLSTIVSKWVGETSENIDRVLRQVSGSEAVLLFDEADALYGKRASEVNDAQDRYVNIDTGHLMVAIERFDGVVLLATNQKSAIDPAFLRRIRYLVDFPMPDPEQRLEIWRRTMTGLLERRLPKGLSTALGTVAASVEMTGAQIKSAALSAVLSARRRGATPALGDLASGVSRELTKVGRALSQRDLERLVRHGR